VHSTWRRDEKATWIYIARSKSKYKEVLGDIIQPDNSLYSLGGSISWKPGDKLIIDNDPNCLELTPTFLRALAWWIETYN
jgi:hypothetical protein